MKLLQVPDGLRKRVLKIADEIEDVYIDLDSCYGACDIDVDKAKKLNCEKIIHYGHSKLIDTDIPVEYRELRKKIYITPILKRDIEKIRGNNIGLVTSIQFIDCLDEIKEFLESKNKKVINGGQVLGCKIPKLDVDCYLYIGSGRFHAIGIALETDKPVFVLDVEKNKIVDINDLKEKFLKQRYSAVGLAKDAKSFGILVSTKPGQFNLELANKIKKRLKDQGKKAYILVMNEIKPEKLEGLDLDCYVNTACPRIAIDNRTLFKKPILNPDEIKI
ncbi:MAG: diphthamide biosynthesis enzyme Dph2 [Candidatus Aenigmatarchaeota archaeon]